MNQTQHCRQCRRPFDQNPAAVRQRDVHAVRANWGIGQLGWDQGIAYGDAPSTIKETHVELWAASDLKKFTTENWAGLLFEMQVGHFVYYTIICAKSVCNTRDKTGTIKRFVAKVRSEKYPELSLDRDFAIVSAMIEYCKKNPDRRSPYVPFE